MIDYAEKLMKSGAVFATERVSGINDNMPTPHYHEFYELYYLESGQRYHFIDNNMYNVEGGQFLLFEPYMLHHSYGEKDVPFCRLVIYFREDEIISEELKEILKGSTGAYQLSKDETHQFYQLMNMIYTEKQNPQEYSNEYCQSLLNTMLIILFRNKRQKMKLIQKNQITEIISYINANYMYDLSIADIAGHFYMSPFYLCREFKKYTNSTINQYINKTRIMNAQRMLYSSDDNITNISINTGFASVSHFGRVFKEITGSTPTSWRKRRKSFV